MLLHQGWQIVAWGACGAFFYLNTIYALRLKKPSGLGQYRALSNLKNFSKSEAMDMGISSTEQYNLQLNFKFKWTSSALKYLWTYIPPVIGPCLKTELSAPSQPST